MPRKSTKVLTVIPLNDDHSEVDEPQQKRKQPELCGSTGADYPDSPKKPKRQRKSRAKPKPAAESDTSTEKQVGQVESDNITPSGDAAAAAAPPVPVKPLGESTPVQPARPKSPPVLPQRKRKAASNGQLPDHLKKANETRLRQKIEREILEKQEREKKQEEELREKILSVVREQQTREPRIPFKQRLKKPFPQMDVDTEDTEDEAENDDGNPMYGMIFKR